MSLSQIVNSVRTGEEQPMQDTLYKSLVSEAEMGRSGDGQSLGSKSLKEFYLKKPQCYEADVKEKIFFIAQNALKGQTLPQASAAND